MKLEIGMAVLPTVTSKSGKSSKTDHVTRITIQKWHIRILKFTVSELTIHITSMFGRIGITASRDGAKTRTTCWLLDVWLTDSSRC